MTHSRRLLLSVFALVFLLGLRDRAVRHPSTPVPGQAPADAFSFSEPRKIRVTHLSLDLTVDFDRHELRGSARLSLDNPNDVATLILDTESLAISRITGNDGTTPLTFTLGPIGNFGRALNIAIPPDTNRVTIEYTTDPFASGLLWNFAEQSYGRTQKFLYSQNEPSSARSWIPIQDTPSVRFTYDATLRVPPTHLALMSASNNPRATNSTGVYHFTMSHSMPAYLVAIAVGRLEYHAFDERTGVYAEPELMAAARHELAYMPQLLAAAERILGQFPFPRHDLLLMPPTYIVGGMEHPMLNFINPFGAVNGNGLVNPEPRSLLAHELAHSWAGDATTLANWNDIWLNEGITSYLTVRLMEELLGPQRAELIYFNDRRSYENLARNSTDPSTILHGNLAHPNSGFSATAYTKGELFLRTLEDTLGRSTLDSFLRSYFAYHAFRWVDADSFVSLLRAKVGQQKIDEAKVIEWIYAPGLPSNLSAPTSSAMYTTAQQRATAFTNGATMTSLDPRSWSETELDLFLQLVPSTTFRARASEIDAAFGLSLRNAPPLLFLLNAIRADYAPANAAVERVLMRGGPNGAIPQLYSALAQTAAGHARATEIFSRARNRYHPSVQGQVQQILAQATTSLSAAA